MGSGRPTDKEETASARRLRNFSIEGMDPRGPSSMTVHWKMWSANHELRGSFTFSRAPEEHLWAMLDGFRTVLFKRVQSDFGERA